MPSMTSSNSAEQCYADLAVFAEDEAIPAAALRVLWARFGMDADDVAELASAMASHSLASLDGVDENWSLRLHDLQRAYALACTGDVAALHGAYVDAWAMQCPDRALERGPTDTAARAYFYARLPYHLSAAGRADELRRLLACYAWLDGKLRFAGVAELLADYQHVADGESQDLLTIRDGLRLSSHVLARDPDQLPGQLIGRLGRMRDNVRIRALLDRAHIEPTHSWLCPSAPGLTPPGGPLLRTFEGHSSSVRSVALSEDGKRALSGSDDSTVKFLDVYRPCLRNRWNYTRPARATLA